MILLAVALAAATPAPVVVSALESEQLARACQGKDRDPRPNFCTGYILGVFDALSLTHEICPAPAKASTGEAIAAVRKALRSRPETWISAPSFIVRDALQKAFPCKRR
ncbi:Rap1a/Tai family immunity protein [Sphingomonas sp.]|uniref:Rap1a/Tai family immunity protein n=1 Tax=Sphingomonas sp. TaxID=28214 RepID=UPI00333FA858